MALPFLIERDPQRIRRSLDIHAEVLAYLEAVEKVSAKERLAGLYREGEIEYPDRPPILDDYDRFERYGWPDPGTWKDQVVHFFLDMEAVRHSKEVWQYHRVVSEQKGQFVRLPEMPEIIPPQSL